MNTIGASQIHLFIGSTEHLFSAICTDSLFGGALKKEDGTLATGNLERYCWPNRRGGRGFFC